ncbi:hypothetical protein [Acinetobacter bereziniae]|uniref:hypothetical protein n=1 Tax=Acinetobacter bereziniae TaxID=106648 RepID=UPI003009B9B8
MRFGLLLSIIYFAVLCLALVNALKQNQFNPLAMRVITKLTQLSNHDITEKSETF